MQQSIKPIEILIINNGKLPIIKKDLQKNILIKVKNISPYIGIATARNVGGKKAEGEYIAFLDDDDFWPKNYLKNFINEVDKVYDCYICKIIGFDNNKFFKWKTPTVSKIKIENLFLKNPGINGSNIIVSKKIFKDYLFDKKLKTGEDKSFVIDLLLNNKKIKILKKSYSYYYSSKDKTKLSHINNVL
ncbi:glycosyltransferase family 2 protein, partial [Candidatus Pelagibacter sp.]|nr:glycosyltransferase family 2 protein [Candidatus Pelagibacter sp.]